MAQVSGLERVACVTEGLFEILVRGLVPVYQVVVVPCQSKDEQAELFAMKKGTAYSE